MIFMPGPSLKQKVPVDIFLNLTLLIHTLHVTKQRCDKLQRVVTGEAGTLPVHDFRRSELMSDGLNSGPKTDL